jgi:hypothetical protein
LFERGARPLGRITLDKERSNHLRLPRLSNGQAT